MKAKKTKGKRAAQEVTRWAPPHGYFAVVAFLIVAALGTLLVNMLYRDRALPGVYVGNVAVNGLAAPEVQKVVETQKEQLKVVFQDGDTSLTATAAELGMTVDVERTVESILAARRGGDITDNLTLWKNQSIPLSYTNDPGVLKEYISRNFPKTYVDPQDAQLVFNDVTKQFDVKPGVPGKGFDIKRFETALPDLARNPRLLVLPVTTVPVEPLIGDAAVEKTKKDINEQIAVKIELKRDGQVAYTVAAEEIAKKPVIDTKIQWAVFIVIFIPIAIGMIIFGYYAFKGEYDQLPENSKEI